MQYKLFGGDSGLRISEFALGAGTFGTAWGYGSDPNEARRVFDRYAERGGNFIDTADFYQFGQSERLARLSQFLTRNPRKWLILSPRYGANELRLSPQIDFDRGRFGVVVALVKTNRDDGGSVEPAPRVE